MRVADYIMQRLYDAGAKHLFMVTGRGVLYLSDAAAKHEKMECVSVHHEQAGAYAAMAYAQYNQKIGAVLVSTGCASTNAITPVLCSWQDDVPLVVISGQNTLKETTRYTGVAVRTFGQQEADVISLVKPITKYAVMLEDPQRVAYELDKALYLAQSGRKGPVWIDVPLDVQNMRVEPETLERFVLSEKIQDIVETDVNYAVTALKSAKRPVCLIGSGIRSAAAEELLQLFIERTNIPVVCSSSATDVYNADNELFIGTIGSMGANRAANFAIQNSDLVLVLGNRLSSMTVGSSPEKFARDAKIIIVDIDSEEIKKNTVRADYFVHGNVWGFLKQVLASNLSKTDDLWVNKCKHWKAVFPKCEEKYKKQDKTDLYYLADRLSMYMEKDAIVVSDAGIEELIIPTTVDFCGGRRCLHPNSQGAMGYALPAAMGAYYASGKQVIAVIGDGSIMMNIQELQTVKYKKIPLKVIVVNNNCYAVIRKRQKDLFRTRTVGTDSGDGVSCPDFGKVAACFGLAYEKIEKSSEIDRKLPQVLSKKESVVCEVMAPEDQEYICCAYARSLSGRFVQRPLEDQAPFMERDLFLAEMIVEPIDQ